MIAASTASPFTRCSSRRIFASSGAGLANPEQRKHCSEASAAHSLIAVNDRVPAATAAAASNKIDTKESSTAATLLVCAESRLRPFPIFVICQLLGVPYSGPHVFGHQDISRTSAASVIHAPSRGRRSSSS
ncbi:hypothetical protein GCM10011609_84730 [Lentzea pudingi]|uniref:Uncharacterized protein n=1 Tax=Lentzea pudingi TaxID=1789439 RepID=A0ABQ2IVL3_9PSEU|nr:hypothetical protein GCM10011609_84730 [Lentzea pudingi]